MKNLKIIVAVLLIFTLLAGCARKKEEEVTDIVFPQEVLNLAEDFVVDLLSQRYDDVVNADLDVKMQMTLTKELAESIYTELITKCGFFNTVEEITTEIDQEYGVVVVICKFDLIHVNMRVYVDNNMQIAGLQYTYNKEYEAKAINEQEISFGQEFEIFGTLSQPESDSDVPLVIIVGGSGPTDRNGVISAATPYYDIAHSLYDKGIATIRYDKRTLTYGQFYSNNMDGMTIWDETVNDAALAYYYAKTLPGIDKDNIYIIGHSLGGYAMGRIASMIDDEAAGYILMAPNASHLEDLIMDQLDYLNQFDGITTDTEKKTYETYKIQRDNIKNLTKDSILTYDVLLNAPKSYWLDLQNYDPIKSMAFVTKPVIVMHGDRDYQVNMEEYQKWVDAYSTKDNFTFANFPKMNHLFIAGMGPSSPEDYSYARSVDQTVIDTIADFILK
ncbi:MAG: prolyl oligopeptidase family serine peptidase [Clostridia bacterium]|nr:prolyl oligopeptidase family serine peptidase [Clostridia bacterium]